MSNVRDRLLAAIAATPPEKRGYVLRESSVRGVAVSFTDLLTDLAPFIEAEILRAADDERAYRKRREAAIMAAVGPVCDGGQYVNDIVSAVERMKRELGKAQAEIARLNADLARLGALKSEEVAEVLERFRAAFGVNVPPVPPEMKA